MDDAVEKLKRDGKDMWLKAAQHGNRFLLPRRLKEGDPEKDALYDAAGWLVMEGYARWIDSSSSMAPGIYLITRP